MDDVLDLIMGIDKKNEIINLWYEVSYVRLLLTEIVKQSPELAKCLTEEMIAKTRLDAQDIVKARFPLMKVEFLTPEQAEEKRKKSDHSLKDLLNNDTISSPELKSLMTAISDQKEGPACNH